MNCLMLQGATLLGYVFIRILIANILPMTSKVPCGFLILEGETYKQKLPFYEGESIIGRNSSKATLVIKDKSISTVHAKLTVKDKKITLTDLESKNGVFLNDPQKQLENHVETVIDPKKDVVYFAEIKCRIEPNWLSESAQNTSITKPAINQKLGHQQSKQEKSRLPDNSNKEGHKDRYNTIISLITGETEEQEEDSKAQQSKESKASSKPNKNSKQHQKNSSRSSSSQQQKQTKNKGKKNTLIETVEQNQESQQSITKPPPKNKKPSKEKPARKNSKQKQSITHTKSVVEAKIEEPNQSIYSRNNSDRKSFSGETKGRSKKLKNSKSLNEKKMETKKETKVDLNVRKKPLVRNESPSYQRNMRKIERKKALCSNFVLSIIPSVRIDIVDDWREPFDVLVMDKYIRTFKLLYAICKGVSIVRSTWVLQSEFTRTLLPLERFPLQCSQKEIIQKSIEKVRSGFKVFSGHVFFLLSDPEEYHLPVQRIEALIEAGGGIMATQAKGANKSKSMVMIVSNQISKLAIQKLKESGYKKAYKVELILDGALHQQLFWEQCEVISTLSK